MNVEKKPYDMFNSIGERMYLNYISITVLVVTIFIFIMLYYTFFTRNKNFVQVLVGVIASNLVLISIMFLLYKKDIGFFDTRLIWAFLAKITIFTLVSLTLAHIFAPLPEC